MSPSTIACVASHLSINRSADAQGVVLTLSGELDLSSAPELERQLNAVLAEAHPRVVLDLEELSFVDSVGVNVLFRGKKTADSAGVQLVFRRPTAQLDRVFALVGVVDWLDVD